MWLFEEKGTEQVNNKKSYTYPPHSVCSLPLIVLHDQPTMGWFSGGGENILPKFGYSREQVTYCRHLYFLSVSHRYKSN